MKFTMHKGFSLVEVLIAASIITIGIVALIASYTVYVNYAFSNMSNVQASYIAQEGLEAMTWIRDNGWTNNIAPLSTSTPYYLVFSSNMWKPTTTPQYINSTFLRTITISDVQRDLTARLVSSGGTYDANTKLVTVTVDYFQGHATTTKTIMTYLTNVNSD